jgi:hypothetical protein
MHAADVKLTEAEADYERAKDQFETEDARTTNRRQVERRKYEARIAALRLERDAAETAHRDEVRRWQEN